MVGGGPVVGTDTPCIMVKVDYGKLVLIQVIF